MTNLIMETKPESGALPMGASAVTPETGVSGSDFWATQHNSPVGHVAHKDALVFEGVGNIDFDTDLWFKLRGHGLNSLVDAATPLLGLILRIRDLPEFTQVDQLYSRVHGDIAAIEEEVANKNLDSSIQIAYRYCLCAFSDEAVRSTPWGAQSVWSNNSMLSVYHQETWGGEKFFTVLSRMMMEPGSYRDMLEFLYLCLVLGYKGKYGLMQDGHQQLNAIIAKLHRLLREIRGDRPEKLLDTSDNISASKYQVSRQMPLWQVWVGLGVVLCAIYFAYSWSLSGVTDDVLNQLQLILQQ